MPVHLLLHQVPQKNSGEQAPSNRNQRSGQARLDQSRQGSDGSVAEITITLTEGCCSATAAPTTDLLLKF